MGTFSGNGQTGSAPSGRIGCHDATRYDFQAYEFLCTKQQRLAFIAVVLAAAIETFGRTLYSTFGRRYATQREHLRRRRNPGTRFLIRCGSDSVYRLLCEEIVQVAVSRSFARPNGATIRSNTENFQHACAPNRAEIGRSVETTRFFRGKIILGWGFLHHLFVLPVSSSDCRNALSTISCALSMQVLERYHPRTAEMR